MSKELIVNSSPQETRVAILEDDQLVEVYVEQQSQHVLAGSIYKGRVTRVLPGMQSAFVDIGLERDAFLYVSDFFEENEDYERVSTDEVEDAATKASEKQERAEAETAPVKRERRDRKRRSRRRRGRRSDFPESKYTSVGESRPAKTPAAPEAAPKAQQTREPELTVLPGESLAKYGDRSDEAATAQAEGDVDVISDQEPARQSEPEETTEGRRNPSDVSAEALTGTDSDRVGDRSAEGDLLQASSKADPDPPSTKGGDEPDSPLASQDAARELPLDNDAPTKAKAAEAAASQPAWETGQDQPAIDEPTGETESVDVDSPGERTSQPPKTGFSSQATVDPSPESTEERPTPSLPKTTGEFHSGEESGERADDEEAASAGEAQAPEKSEKDSTEPEPSDREDRDRERVRLRGRSGSARYLRRRGRRGRRRGGRERSTPEPQPSREGASETTTTEADSGRKITDLLAKGQEILVQIAKEPLGRKGARITSHIALPGRFLVYMPTVEHVGVSRKIASDKERTRLRKIVHTHRTGMPGGFIVRTAGEDVEEEDIHGDMLFLYNLWLDIKEKSDRSPAPALIHHDDDVVERVLRDRLGEEFKTIWVDNEEEYERILRFVERFQPELLRAVKLFTRPKPIYDEFNISGELEKALRPKVWLKSGGYIVISPTEALVAIDVNTGKYVGKSDRLEDTIVNTNLEAVKEIVRQLRIRDLGGIIVVDFIDMEDRSNRHKVLAALEKELRQDIAPSKVLPFNEFGLVAITRKRVKQSLDRSLCTPCPYCHGASYVKSVPTVIRDIFVEAKKMAATKEPKKDMTLRVNPEVARRLKSKDNNYLQGLEQILRAHVLVRSDVSLNREHFDIH